MAQKKASGKGAVYKGNLPMPATTKEGKKTSGLKPKSKSKSK